MLKSLWLSRLPTTTRSIVGALSDELLKLAPVADKIHDLAVFPQINETANVPPTPATHASSLELQIAQLTQYVSELTTKLNQRSRSREHHPREGNFRQWSYE